MTHRLTRIVYCDKRVNAALVAPHYMADFKRRQPTKAMLRALARIATKRHGIPYVASLRRAAPVDGGWTVRVLPRVEAD